MDEAEISVESQCPSALVLALIHTEHKPESSEDEGMMQAFCKQASQLYI